MSDAIRIRVVTLSGETHNVTVREGERPEMSHGAMTFTLSDENGHLRAFFAQVNAAYVDDGTVVS